MGLKRNLLRLLILFLLPLILSGCIPNISKQDNSGEEKKEFVKGKVLEGFPNLPLYPEAQVVESYGANNFYGAAFMSKDDLAKVLNFYRESLAVFGWEYTEVVNSQNNYSFTIKNSQNKGTVIVNTASDGLKTAITMSLGPR